MLAIMMLIIEGRWQLHRWQKHYKPPQQLEHPLIDLVNNIF